MTNFTKNQKKQVIEAVQKLRQLDNWASFYEALKAAQVSQIEANETDENGILLEELRTFCLGMERLETSLQ